MPVATHRGNTSFLPFTDYVSTPVSFLTPWGLILLSGPINWENVLDAGL